jgi:predicted amidophosphoribosyltransferase
MVLPARTVLAVVPGHDERSTNRERALGRVVARLVSDIGSRFVDGSDALLRHRTIQKLATGGDRGAHVHRGSVRVAADELVMGRSVVVLDDVTSTGNSLRACVDLLQEAGASRVIGVALARAA